ncbi:MAG: IS1380 family transposase [Desulfobacterales bacterium]|jgi:hypothetical protein
MMRSFNVQFTEKNLTGNAGLVHLGRFIDKLGLCQALQGGISIERGANAKYSIADTVLILALGVLAGAKHLSHLVILRYDSALRKLFKWDQFPDETTFGRIFRLFSQKNCKELSDVESTIRKKVWSKKWFPQITLDMDSTVRGVYGNQQGAEKGYNPKKKGQKSYHPLLCFIAETRECLNNWFRSGSAYSANGCVEFMKECFARLPKIVSQIVVRGDSAFFNGDLFDFLEEKASHYIVKVKLKGLVQLLERQSWHKAKNQPGYETAEFTHTCTGWKKPRRFVAVRKITETEADSNSLFPNIPNIEYDYFCYCTNMNLTPWEAHKYYGKRATSENWIEWCKNQMASGSILTQEFWANSAIFQSCILGYNLMVWMMMLTQEDGFNEEPNTIRMKLIHVAARLKTRSRQYSLRLDKNFAFKERWIELENSILAMAFT